MIVRDGLLNIPNITHRTSPTAGFGYNPWMPHVVVDPESKSLQERPALIKTPRKTRKRYPEGCVSVVASVEEALEGANEAKNLHPAVVYGPSVSSESQRIYYLVRWL